MTDSRLLLADEDDAARTFLSDNLSADGYHVDAARDRDEALQRLRTTTPDLILAGVNGQTLGLLDWLRTADGTFYAAATDTPVIVLSSHTDELHRVRLLERGADDVIAKPFSYPELRARVGAVLRRSAPRRPPTLMVGARSASMCETARSRSTSDPCASQQLSTGCCPNWCQSPPGCSRARS